MRTVLKRRDSGDLKGNDPVTKEFITKIKKTYLSPTEKGHMGSELSRIQLKIRSQSNWIGSIKANPEYVTEHLKLTCRYVMKKFPL